MTGAALTASGVAIDTDSLAVSGSIDGVRVAGNWSATLYGVDNAAGTGDANVPSGYTCPKYGCSADLAGFTGRFRAGDFTDDGTDITPGGDVVAIGGAFGAAPK